MNDITREKLLMELEQMRERQINMINIEFDRLKEIISGKKVDLIPQNSKRFSDSEESTNPAVTVTKRQA